MNCAKRGQIAEQAAIDRFPSSTKESNHSAVDVLVSPAQASEKLGVSAGTLAVWRSTGRRALPYVKLGSRVKYRQRDLDAFISAGLRNVGVQK